MNAGLIILIVVAIADVVGLTIDGVLYLTLGYDYTITALVRSSSSTGEIIGIAIVALQFIAGLGAYWHFWKAG